MKKLIEITELKVGDVIGKEGYVDTYTVEGIIGNVVVYANKYNAFQTTIKNAKEQYKKQVEQERWRAERYGIYNFINEEGEVREAIDTQYKDQTWHQRRYELGNYFKPGEAQKHVEAFKEFFNKIKQDG